MAQAFGDRLARAVEARHSQVVLGLDPDPSALWPEALREDEPGQEPAGGQDARVRTAGAVARHCRLAIEAAGPACVAVKLQLACFERLGAPGWEALERTAVVARERGLLVIADGKRGDVPVTAAAYGEALVGATHGPFGAVAGLGVDAFTANPLLGRDALEPLVEAATAAGAGCFCLVRTSNAGAGDLQDLPAPSAPLHEALARLVDALGAPSAPDSGLASVGAVVGATAPDRIARLRELMPRAVFLLPGVGAQGGAVEALGAAFDPHPAGGLVAASRSIVDAWRATGQDPASTAEAAVLALRDAVWRLSGAG